MFETVLILIASLALFVYWFRYTVLLLLREEKVSAGHTTVIDQLSVLETREALRKAQEAASLDPLRCALDRDYRLLRYLLNHAAGMGLAPLEHHLLILDYRLMNVWYRLTRSASTTHARGALDEMADVLSCLAYKMGQRTAGFSQA